MHDIDAIKNWKQKITLLLVDRLAIQKKKKATRKRASARKWGKIAIQASGRRHGNKVIAPIHQKDMILSWIRCSEHTMSANPMANSSNKVCKVRKRGKHRYFSISASDW
jgi:hypothetical protein